MGSVCPSGLKWLSTWRWLAVRQDLMPLSSGLAAPAQGLKDALEVAAHWPSPTGDPLMLDAVMG